MKAAVLFKPLDLRIVELPKPSLRADEVLIRIKVCGICRSDYHYWKHGRIGEFVVSRPLILGHEASGIVEEVGGEVVKELKRGDKVVIEPGVPCGECAYCRSGRYNLCPNVKFMATPPIDGAFAEYVAWDYRFIYRMPPGMSFEEGAMVEPLSVALWAVNRAGVKPGASAAVFGVGTIGMLTLEVLKAVGVTRVYVVDIDDWKLDFALKLGAEAAFNPRRENAAEAIKRATGGEGVDYVFEASGAEEASRQAIRAAKRGGKVVLIGLYASTQFQYPVLEVITRELDLIGVFRYANMFPPAIELISKRRVDVERLVTHKIPFERLEEGFRIMDEGKEKFIKIQVLVGRQGP